MKRLKKVSVLSHEWNIFLVLLSIISISLFSWWTVKIHLEKEWNARLASEVEKVSSVITREFYGYGHAILDTKAFFQLVGVPTPKQFETFVESSKLLERFPGLQGMAYAQILNKADIPQIEKQMFDFGYQDFRFWPEGERSFYTAIIRVQPDEWRNKRTLGFDMYSDPLRQKAMDKALETNSFAITDPVVLVNDDQGRDPRGFLVYLPLLKNNVSINNHDPKTDTQGFIYSIVRLHRFFNGALAVPEFYNEKVNYKISMQGSDGKTVPLYERFPSKENDRVISEVFTDKEIRIFDKTWTLHFEPLPHFYNWYERYIPILFAIVTLILLSVVFLALWSTQQFLRMSEKNKESLALVSKNKTNDILLFRKLNMMVADLSAAIESHNLFDKFCFHLNDMFQIEDCVIYVRERSGPYEKRFQKELDLFPPTLEVADEFEAKGSEGVLSAAAQDDESLRLVSCISLSARRVLIEKGYYLMRTVLHESGKATSVLMFIKGPPSLCETKMAEYALLRIFEQFATSYDKAILLRRAEDANLMKSSFLANMSHEIRTPLGVIIGYSEMLAQEGMSLEDKNEIVKNVKRNGKDLARLIDDILDISKVEAGKLHFEMTQVSLDSLMEEMKSIMDSRASEKHVQFTVAKLSNVPNYIVTDDIRLKQILVNIVGNAIKFTEKGSVKLLYSVFTDDRKQEFLDFQVQDTGIGISEQSREGLFRPFSQGDVTSTRKYGGTGLGLALSKRLAELLGGDLFLHESILGKGSTFCLRIPLKAVPAYALPLKDDLFKKVDVSFEEEVVVSNSRDLEWKKLNLVNPLQGVKILLVEDSEDNQEIFGHFLRAAGADVVFAEDGAVAIESAFKHKPQLILMDIQIPKIDGKEATRKIRQKGFTEPIVALTAHALHEEMKSCIAAGCNGQITKPVAGDLLIQEVYFYLNHRG